MTDITTPLRYRFETVSRSKILSSPESVSYDSRQLTATNHKYTEDTKGRDWKAYIRAGQLISSEMNVVRNDIIARAPWYGKRVQRRLSDGQEHMTSIRGDIPMALLQFTPTPSVDGSAYTQARNQAAARFYSAAQQTQTRFKGMVFTGELRETLRMIKSPAQSIRRLFSSHLRRVKKHSSVRNKKDRLRRVRDNWLETQYGLKPLISDTESALDAFYSSSAVRPLAEMVRGFGSSSSGGEVGYNSYGVPNNCLLRVVRKSTVSYQVKYYGLIRSTGEGPSRPQLYGFRVNEFVPTLWELIPWSFVVDYFTNVGQVLESWSYRSVYSGGAIMTKVVDTTNEICHVSWEKTSTLTGYTDAELTFAPGQLSARRRAITRFPASPVTPPSLGLRVPGMGTKWINLAALASQLADARRALR